MKRFHIHLHVQDLNQNIAFYSHLFDAQPARVEADYAKWMLTDPPVNFAISTRGQGAVGLDHLGLQAETEQELAELKGRAERADLPTRNDGVTTCCYARSDKYWTVDPQGVPWEHFQTLGSIPLFREEQKANKPTDAPAKAGGACCGPTASASACC